MVCKHFKALTEALNLSYLTMAGPHSMWPCGVKVRVIQVGVIQVGLIQVRVIQVGILDYVCMSVYERDKEIEMLKC